MSNEQSAQDYINIINQLLSCNNGDEYRILQEKQELLDEGLIKIMVAVAQQLGDDGRENEAQWLLSIAQQLAKALGLLEDETTATANTHQDYLDFLMETLQKVDKNRNSQMIYPFWVQNLDKLDNNLLQIFDNWSRDTLLSSSINTREFEYIAGVIVNFSNLIQQFPLGNTTTNIEIAIIGYKTALDILTLEAFPEKWAMTQTNLGIAYLYRIKGDKAENLEKAIYSCQEALKVYTFDAFPKQWAAIQHNQGIAYCERIREDKSENLEKAITCYQQALKVRTLDEFPQDWASIHNSLANAYLDRIREDKSENLEKAITCYQQALKVRTLDEFPQDWASTQSNLANAYFERIREDKAENLEQAIICSNEALKVYTLDDLPQQWANIQNNLGNVYLERIREDKAKNLEKAITHYHEALKVRKFEIFKEKWAETINNLAIAYSIRIEGDKDKNLEQAISYYQKAFKVYTLDAFPQRWAMLQNNMGNVYSDRIRESKANNLENAITYYQEALNVYTPEAFPEKWAMLQNNLAITYRNRIREDKAENIEKSITYYQRALKVYTFEAFPQDWAMIQNNLVLAYSDRIRGDKAENLEKAIYFCQEALKVYTFEAFPQDWAMTRNNLATVYSNRIRGDKAGNLENAINHYQEALKVRKFETFPQEWADIQHNLAAAYSDRIEGSKTDNLEKAITYYQEALRVRKFESFPQDWAMTQNNLATAYSDRIRGDKAENLERAITAYHNALKIRTQEDDPLKCLQTARNLANLHYNEQQWQSATKAYHLAIEALENARLEALNPQSRQETLSNAIDVFHRIVQAHLNLNQPDRALEYIERSKARNLVELMTQKNLQPQGVNQTTIEQLNELRQNVVNEQIRLQHQSINQNISRTDSLTPYITDQSHLKEYQQELDNFIEQKITPVDPTFKLTQKVEPISFQDIRALTDPETCLLQWYITSEKILAFIVPADGNIQYWQSSATDLQTLTETLNDYLMLYYSEKSKQKWIDRLPTLLQTFADTIHIHDILSLIPPTCKRLIIIPHRYLHILPIHALPISNSLVFNDNRETTELHDLFSKGVQYAPSCQLLQIAKTFHYSDFNKLFAIQNPTSDLLYTDLEVNTLTNFFTESQIIIKDNATKDTVTSHLQSSAYHCYHFSCHGGFNPSNPLESALFLANKEPLNLSEIFELNLKKSRLVVLSACETGLTDLQSVSDEYIGLPSGFLFAGSRSVVSSLWTVSDLSTAFLMIKFYEILFDQTQQVSVAVALKEAQDWLQNLTIEVLDKFLEQYKSQLEKTLAQLRKGQRLRIEESLKQIRQRQPYPFANPYYWAAFIATGD